MSHGYYVLDAIKDYERLCAEFSEKCTEVLNGTVKAYYTKLKITDSFWLLAAFYKVGDAYLECKIYRGSYNGKVQGMTVKQGDKVVTNCLCKKPLSEIVIDFPELKKAKWFDHWPSLEELG